MNRLFGKGVLFQAILLLDAFVYFGEKKMLTNFDINVSPPLDKKVVFF